MYSKFNVESDSAVNHSIWSETLLMGLMKCVGGGASGVSVGTIRAFFCSQRCSCERSSSVECFDLYHHLLTLSAEKLDDVNNSTMKEN